MLSHLHLALLLAGKLELAPLVIFQNVLVNGGIQASPPSVFYAGVTLALCYGGGMFGVSDNPVSWKKDGELFSISMQIPSELTVCNEYLSAVLSDPEVAGNKKRVQSFVSLYRSDPCLLYKNMFLAILLIQSLEINDNGLYDFYLENQDGTALLDGKMQLNEIGQPSH